MTKKFWLIALIVACTVVFGSCDKSEELSVEQCKLDMNLFNQTYTVNDEGCCVLKGRNLSSTYKCNFLGADNKQ